MRVPGFFWDTLYTISTDCLYVLELSVGYESNLENNVDRKRKRYKDLIRDQKKHFKSVKFVNLSISSLGVFSKEIKECHTFLDMLKNLGLDTKHQHYCMTEENYFYRHKNNILYFVAEIRS